MKFTVPLESRLAHGVSSEVLVLRGVEVYFLVGRQPSTSTRWMRKSETSEPAKI